MLISRSYCGRSCRPRSDSLGVESCKAMAVASVQIWITSPEVPSLGQHFCGPNGVCEPINRGPRHAKTCCRTGVQRMRRCPIRTTLPLNQIFPTSKLPSLIENSRMTPDTNHVLLPLLLKRTQGGSSQSEAALLLVGGLWASARTSQDTSCTPWSDILGIPTIY
jgi:hypothetical protein